MGLQFDRAFGGKDRCLAVIVILEQGVIDDGLPFSHTLTLDPP